MLSVLSTIGYIILVVLMFSLAIFIHEFGHFIVAAKLGFKIDAFSIGFGPAIWKKRINGVEYRISWILFGGYVALPQLDPAGMEKVQGKHGEEDEEKSDDKSAESDAPVLPDISPWKRIAVAAAGPLGNTVLAVALALLLAVVPWAHFGELGTEVSEVIEGCPACCSGIRAGDVIEAVNGHAVRNWNEMQTEVLISGEKPTEFIVNREGVRLSFTLTPARDAATGGCYVGLLAVPNTQKASAWMPARNPIRQLEWDAGAIFRVLKALVTPKEAKTVASQLGGPVSIAKGLYVQARRNSIWDALGFLRFLCINLMIINLLPLPVLDGGHCMFALWEIVTRRKPNRKFVETVSTIFGYALIALMLWLVYSDCARMWRVNRANSEAEAASVAR